jgi:hypothetical protein
MPILQQLADCLKILPARPELIELRNNAAVDAAH